MKHGVIIHFRLPTKNLPTLFVTFHLHLFPIIIPESKHLLLVATDNRFPGVIMIPIHPLMMAGLLELPVFDLNHL